MLAHNSNIVFESGDVQMNTIKPIEFILPNSILSLTEWNTRVVNEQDITFSMEHLYLLINFILDHIFKPGVPFDFLTKDVFNNPLRVLEENKLEIIEHYGLILILAFVLISLAIFVPIIWMLCCCFCLTSKPPKRSHRSSARSERGSRNTQVITRHKFRSHKYDVEEPCDFCFRPILSFILLGLLVFCLLFIICSLVTNDVVYNGVRELPKAANNSLSDVEIYLNNTQYELDILFKTNFAQLESQLRSNLEMSGDIVKNRLAVISEAISIDNLTQIVLNLQPILHDLKKLINNTNELKFLTAQLKGKIGRAKKDLEEFFTVCKHPTCNELQDKYQHFMKSFSISSRIDSLPKLSPIIEKIQYLLGRDIVSEIRKGKQKLDYLSSEIQNVVNDIAPNIRANIAHANKALIENVDNINRLIAQPVPQLRSIQQEISKSDQFLKTHDYYIHYAGLVCSFILFLTLSCYVLGLLCGLCNDQPTRYNYRKRSKKPDFCFYLGMSIFFLSFSCLLVLSTTSFLFGGLSDRSFCFYLENISDPRSERVISMLQSEIENAFTDSSVVMKDVKMLFANVKNIKLIDVMRRCHQNHSLYDVLQLSLDQKIKVDNDGKPNYLNLSEVILFKEKHNIENYLNGLLLKLDVNPSNIVLLTNEGEQLLNVLKDTPLETLNFSNFANIIKHSITPLDLEMLAKKLDEESYRLPEHEIENIARLRNIAIDLKSSKDLIGLITTKIENLTRNAEKIERKSHYNGKGLRETLVILLRQAHDAQRFINQRGKSEIKVVLKNFTHDISTLISQYISHVENRIKREVGRCEPVSRAYNYTVASLCDDIVLPFTACWFSIAATLLLFLPATVLVCSLNSLLKRVKRSSARRESILIIDHFEDDDIPLAEIDKPSSRRSVLPSAPIGTFGESHSEEETWSPGALPQHLYSRPPPYHF